jgi:hypothetical protein
MSLIYCFLIIVFVYIFSLFTGILSSLILRLGEWVILSQNSLTSLKMKREMREGFISQNLAYSSLNPISPILRLEDFVTGVIRGGLAAFATFELVGLMIDLENGLIFFSIILSHIITILRYWRKENRKSDEFFNWFGDFLGIVILFLIYNN